MAAVYGCTGGVLLKNTWPEYGEAESSSHALVQLCALAMSIKMRPQRWYPTCHQGVILLQKGTSYSNSHKERNMLTTALAVIINSPWHSLTYPSPLQD